MPLLTLQAGRRVSLYNCIVYMKVAAIAASVLVDNCVDTGIYITKIVSTIRKVIFYKRFPLPLWDVPIARSTMEPEHDSCLHRNIESVLVSCEMQNLF